MPDFDGLNFTQPYDPNNDPGSSGTPQGTGDQGEKWDPVSKRWIPVGQAGNIPMAPTGAGDISNHSGNNYGTDGHTVNNSGEPSTTGKVLSPGAWGGYTGRMVDDGQGGVRFDNSINGRTESVDHLRGLGAAAANQAAYQNDYGDANRFSGMGQESRNYQNDSLGMALGTAQGRNLQSMALGRNMLQQGVQAQQAGAASTRGGSLAQAAAMRQQAAGQGAFMQQGNNALEAQRAAEMAAGRDEYMRQATNMRAGDAQSQGLNQSQAIHQMENEVAQRDMNQKTSMGYEGLAQDTNIGAASAALQQHEQNAGIADMSMTRHIGKMDQGKGWVDAGVSTVGSLSGSAAGAIGGAGSGGGGSKPDPYSQQVSNSDARGKTKITSLASAALKRRMR